MCLSFFHLAGLEQCPQRRLAVHDRPQWRVRAAGVVADGGGDAGVAGQPHDGDGEVAQGCHDARAAGGADLGAVLAGVHVADPVKAVLDA